MSRFFCYNCYTEQDLLYKEVEEEVRVRGEAIRVSVTLPFCSKCQHRMSTPASDNDLLTAAYAKYREKHGLLTPEDIVNIRKRYDLSQRALAKLLGWGLVTIHRYERGGLPDVSHNQILKSLSDPAVVLDLLDKSTCELHEGEAERLRAVAQGIKRSSRYDSALQALESIWEGEEVNEYTGYRMPDPERLWKMSAYFSRHVPGPLYKVKLMKLLFYSDFSHFSRHSISISGFPYAAIPLGPVPDGYEVFLSWAQLSGRGKVVYVDTSSQPGEVLQPTGREDKGDAFSPSERTTLETVANTLGNLNGSRLAAISHEEEGWKHTPIGQRIAYTWASELRGIAIQAGSER